MAQANAIDSLPPGFWYEVPDSKIADVDPEDDPDANPNWPGIAPWAGVEGQPGVINDWSSAAWDESRGWLMLWGGGHSGYAGNEVYAFDIETLAWTRLTNPSIDVSVTGTTLYTDGQPRARETYNYLEYLPALDRMVSFGGGNLYPCCNVTTELAAFNPDTLTWDTTTLAPHTGSQFFMFGATVSLDPQTGLVWLTQPGNTKMRSYNPQTNSWTGHVTFDTLQYRNAIIDPVMRYLLITGLHGNLYSYNLDTPGQPPVLRNTTGATSIQNIQFPGLTWDSTEERVLGWSSGGAIHALDTKTWEWSLIEPDPANTVVPTAPNGNGTHGRFRYVASKHAVILVNRVTDNVFIFKLPNGDPGRDSDSDGTPDAQDNCIAEPNGPTTPDSGGNVQLDSDGDGIGNL
ncbi:MAG: hypothetical protein HKN49_08310, partial [Gammaproteobacteria bacterium]|nr:hypothetical protein [Gammaproteobacteria bacterium]